jgi:hypothetical protein
MKRIAWIAGLLGLVGIIVLAEDEITLNEYMAVANGAFNLTRNVNQYKVTQLGNSSDYHIQSVQSNAYEQITVVSDVATNGYAFFRMLTTNLARYIDIGPRALDATYTNGPGATYTNFMPFMRLYGSDVATLPLHPTSAIYAQGGTTETNQVPNYELEVWVNEK